MTIDLEKKFQEENGMTVDEAFSLVQKWITEEKAEEARRGKEEILKFFPEHPVRDLLPAVSEELPLPPPPPPRPHHDSLLTQARGFLQKKSHQFAEMNRSHQPSFPQMKPPEEDERFLGVLCYAWFFVLIPLFLRRDSAFIQFHAFQGVVLTAIFTIFDVLIMGFLQIVFGPSFGLVHFFLTLVALAILGTGAFAAWKGKWLALPLVSPLSEKLRKMLEK